MVSISRVLFNTKGLFGTGGEYEVVLRTGGDSSPCQGSSIWLTAYGEKGRSRDFELAATDDGGKERFKPNAKDKFEVGGARVSEYPKSY